IRSRPKRSPPCDRSPSDRFICPLLPPVLDGAHDEPPCFVVRHVAGSRAVTAGERGRQFVVYGLLQRGTESDPPTVPPGPEVEVHPVDGALNLDRRGGARHVGPDPGRAPLCCRRGHLSRSFTHSYRAAWAGL